MSDQECKASRQERWKMKNRAQDHNTEPAQAQDATGQNMKKKTHKLGRGLGV